MRHTLVKIALRSGQPLSELEHMHPRDFATLVDILDDDQRAERLRQQRQ